MSWHGAARAMERYRQFTIDAYELSSGFPQDKNSLNTPRTAAAPRTQTDTIRLPAQQTLLLLLSDQVMENDHRSRIKLLQRISLNDGDLFEREVTRIFY